MRFYRSIKVAFIVVGVMVLLGLSGCLQRTLLYPSPSFRLEKKPDDIKEIVLENKAVAWYSEQEGSDTWLIFFHGNGENLDSLYQNGQFHLFKRHLGVNIIAIDYPGYGQSKGSPNEEDNVKTGLLVSEWVKKKTSAKRIILAGWSLGSGVVSQVAAQQADYERLILISPWQNLHSLAKTHYPSFLVTLFLRDKYASDEAAGKIKKPVLILHGQFDSIIPHEQGSRLSKHFKNVEFITIERTGHNDIFDRAETWLEMKKFLHASKS